MLNDRKEIVIVTENSRFNENEYFNKEMIDCLKIKLRNEIYKQLEIHDNKIKRHLLLKFDFDKDTSGRKFEKFVGEILKLNGYKIKYTATSGDYGVDVIATKENEKICIQCKNWKAKIGVKVIQESFYGKHHYNCSDIWIIAKNGATKNAINAARKSNVKVISLKEFYEKFVSPIEDKLFTGDFEKLKERRTTSIQYLNQLGGYYKEKIDIFQETDKKKCPKCGGTLRLINGKYGKFYGCSNYPRCRYTRNA